MMLECEINGTSHKTCEHIAFLTLLSVKKQADTE